MHAVVTDAGVCEDGDVLLLMSDAIAAWYLQRLEKNDLDPDEIQRTKCDDELSQFLDAERLAGRIRNDDVAILRIEITERRIN